MADFSALKQSIETYIKNNGNKEITGAILQNILLSMVTTMGDGAINDNASDISDIKGDIQNINGDITDINVDITDINGAITNINGDITGLNGDLSDEINRAKGAETTTILFSDGKLVFKNAVGTELYQLSVNSFLSAITTRLNTGALYAGYATPSTTPAALTSQEVFYLATQAGTYTNFHFNGGDDPIVLTKDGIYFIVSGNDDDDWNAEPMLQLDDVPTASSDNAVKSGGVAEELALGAVYDVSAHNSGATFASLSALLSDANINTLIPISIRKGGMSIKFVSSVDNKYVQYRLMANAFNTTVADWQGVDDEPTVGSSNLVKSGGIKKELNRTNQKIELSDNIPFVFSSGNAQIHNTQIVLNSGNSYLIRNTSNDTTNNFAIVLYTLDNVFISDAGTVYGGDTNYSRKTLNITQDCYLCLHGTSINGTVAMNNSIASRIHELENTNDTYKALGIDKHAQSSYLQLGNPLSLSGADGVASSFFNTQLLFKSGKKYKVTNNKASGNNTSVSVCAFDISNDTYVKDLGIVYENSSVTITSDGNYIVKLYSRYSFNITIEELISVETRLNNLETDINQTVENKNSIIDINHNTIAPINFYTESHTPRKFATIIDHVNEGEIYELKLTTESEGEVCYADANGAYIAGVTPLFSGEYKNLYHAGEFVNFQIPNGCSKIIYFCAVSTIGFEITKRDSLVKKVGYLTSLSTNVSQSSMTLGDSIEIPNTPNIKNYYTIGFSAKITSMGTIVLSHGKNAYACGMVKIDGTNVTPYSWDAVEGTPIPHNLTFSEYIDIQIRLGSDTRTAELTIFTGSSSVFTTNITWGGAINNVLAEITSGSYENVILTFGGEGFSKDVWIFSDSYSDFFPLKLELLGYTNYMIDGLSGRGSRDAYASLLNDLKFGKPKVIVWDLGMNNPDTTTVINSQYKSYLDRLVLLCKELNIHLAVCTIPNTSKEVSGSYERINVYKNNYIKSLNGIQVVDLAAMLGAEELGSNWYSGLLGADKVHPTNNGATVIARCLAFSIPTITGNKLIS